MADGPFHHPSIQARIAADVLRIQSGLLEWSVEPTEGDLDSRIVTTLVDTRDAHARAYLDQVDCDSLIPEYTNALRLVGAALIQNAEKRSFLADPYSDDRLRRKTEARAEYTHRRHSLTLEDQEADIRAAVEKIRCDVMKEAVAWRRWRNKLLSRIETRFQARYRHWRSEAMDHVRSSQH